MIKREMRVCRAKKRGASSPSHLRTAVNVNVADRALDPDSDLRLALISLTLSISISLSVSLALIKRTLLQSTLEGEKDQG